MNNLLLRATGSAAALLIYVATHEGGHALAGFLLGRKVVEIRLVSLTPHVLLQGPATAFEQAMAALAGSGAVLLLCCAILLFQRSPRSAFLADCASFFAGIELLAWFLSSCLHTVAPPGNDVTKFINLSGYSPVLVAAAAGVLAIIGVAAASCSAAFPGRGRDLRNRFPSLRDPEKVSPGC